MKKLILSGACALVLVGSLSLAHAQTATTTQSTTTTGATGAAGATTTTATTTTDMSSGTITEFVPGTSVVLRTEAAAPVSYKFSKTVVYTDESGKVIESSLVRKDSKVRVHYVKQGADTIVDKVIVLK